MFHHIINAKYLKDFKVFVTFNDDVQGTIDLYDKIHKKHGIFAPLKDVNVFKQFMIRNHTLSWENGADLAPEMLYDLLQQQSPST